MTKREKFEKWASSAPREYGISKQGLSEAWPNQYRNISVQLAWETYTELCEPKNISLLSAEIVRRIKGSKDSPMNDAQVVENLIREANL